MPPFNASAASDGLVEASDEFKASMRDIVLLNMNFIITTLERQIGDGAVWFDVWMFKAVAAVRRTKGRRLRCSSSLGSMLTNSPCRTDHGRRSALDAR